MDTQHHKRKCQALKPEEEILKKTTNAKQRQLLRQLKKMQLSPTYREVLSYSEIIPIELDIRIMDIICQVCRAFYFAEISNEEDQCTQLEKKLPLNVEIIFDHNQRSAQKRYNSPQANKVAAIVIGSNNDQFFPHHLVVHPCASNPNLQIIPVINANCDPMSYPLIFLAEDKGWHSGILNKHGKNV
ncbi:33907_t:CDS:2 [Racocetra persica]|uniref:33907_t:CDS:1 n=1 Tax=Racocetra persica TaxID=160502 RepID=A0ACA9KX60_9GLOM|nr:33907_t:CDS:2 [Racocetra persica]